MFGPRTIVGHPTLLAFMLNFEYTGVLENHTFYLPKHVSVAYVVDMRTGWF